MKYSLLIFKKDLYELEFSDMEAFFKTEKEENLNLEFLHSRANRPSRRKSYVRTLG
ncbi:hypothetical protein J2W48_000753 [Flavobacterium piscis]|uniref:Uncharacterized protein n=1 Tax=Flavobacterium piscis TaxID=1114874 RepID=A0ABU1Y3M2_9FLAO|nr:hypothetical protein [Flavobacterium piscis]